MRTALLILVALALSAAAQVQNFQFPRMGGSYYASSFAHWQVTTSTPVSAPGYATFEFSPTTVTLVGNDRIQPATTGVPIQVVAGAASEVVTPTAVNCSALYCAVTAIFANAHPGGFTFVSASGGLDEAIQAAAAQGGGTVVVGSDWSGTTAQIAAAAGNSAVAVLDTRAGASVRYTWTGSAYTTAFATTASGGMQAASPNITPTSIEGVEYADQFAGADIGAKINAAIAACPNSGCKVVIPAGTYSFGTTITITKPEVTIAGQGGGGQGAGTTLNYTGTGDAVVLGALGSTSTGNLNLYTTLSDFSLIGQAGTQSGIHCYNASAFTLHGVTVDSFGADGLRLEFCQYGSVYDSVFGANGGYGLNVSEAVIAGFNRGLNEQSNTWVFVNDRFFSNAQWGARLQAALEFVFVEPTFQSNAQGGMVEVGDVAGAIGGVPAGTPSGTASSSNSQLQPHYELNAGYDYYCQLCTTSVLDQPQFDSSNASSGHYVVASNASISGLDLRLPTFLDATNEQISVASCVSCTFELGNSTSAKVSVSATTSLVKNGNTFSSPLVGAAGTTFVIGPTDTNTSTTVQGNDVLLDATNTGGALAYKIAGQTGQWDFTGTASATRFLTLPDSSAHLAAYDVPQTWSAAQTFGTLNATTLEQGGVEVALASQLPFAGLVAESTTSVAAGSCGDAVTATVTGATSSMVATASGAGALPSAGLVLQAAVTSANTVTVEYCNVTTAAIVPAALTIAVRVVQ